MTEWLAKHSRKSWEWFAERSASRHAQAWLAVLAFSESSFFIIPPDVLLIAMLAARAGRWVYLAVLTTFWSLAGAVAGYLIAAFAFEPLAQPLIEAYHLTESFAHVGALYGGNVFWVVFTAAFTPIPFKVFVLSAGFFHVSFIPFLVASLLGRGGRFFLVAWLSHRYGPRAADLFIMHVNRVTYVVVIVLLIAAVVYFDLPNYFFH